MDRPRRQPNPRLPKARVLPRGWSERAHKMRSDTWRVCRHQAAALGRVAIKLAPLGIAGLAVMGIIAALGSMRVHSRLDIDDRGHRLRQLELQLRALEQLPVWRMSYERELSQYERELQIIEIRGEFYLYHPNTSPDGHSFQLMTPDQPLPDGTWSHELEALREAEREAQREIDAGPGHAHAPAVRSRAH